MSKLAQEIINFISRPQLTILQFHPTGGINQYPVIDHNHPHWTDPIRIGDTLTMYLDSEALARTIQHWSEDQIENYLTWLATHIDLHLIWQDIPKHIRELSIMELHRIVLQNELFDAGLLCQI